MKKYFVFLAILLILIFAVFILKGTKAQDPDNLITEKLFPISVTGEAVGVKVMENSSWLTPKQWYKKHAPNPVGNPNYINVDGYPAIKDGRTVYVGAMDVKQANQNNPKVHPRIYLISYSEGASKSTKQIYNSLLENWEFNTNIEDITLRTKLRRDILRIYDLEQIKSFLNNYNLVYNSYPGLKSGTYILGQTTSKWPSWQDTLGKSLGGIEVPVDPINEFNGLCGDCGGDQCSGTCYNTMTENFDHPKGSHVYIYQVPTQGVCEGDYYTLKANFEYKPNSANVVTWKGETDLNIVDSDEDVKSNYIYQPPSAPVCDDGNLDCGEVCDGDMPPRDNATCEDSCTGWDCSPLYGDCDFDLTQNGSNGCEADLSSNLNNCGECNNVCGAPDNATPSCNNGECSWTCDQGYILIDNECIESPNVPAMPTELGVAPNGSSTEKMDIQWQDNATNEDLFKLERDDIIVDENISANPDNDMTDSRDEGLDPYETYTYRVGACNGAGCSWSSSKSGTTYFCVPNATEEVSCDIEDSQGNIIGTGTKTQICNANGSSWGPWTDCECSSNPNTCNNDYHCDDGSCEPDAVVPQIPENFHGQANSSSEIELLWVDTSNEDGYTLEKTNQSTSEIDITNPNDDDPVVYLDTGLDPNTNYQYKVRSYIGSYHSDYTDPITIQTPAVVPVSPDDLSVEFITSNPYHFKLDWTSIADASNYKIYKSQYADGCGAAYSGLWSNCPVYDSIDSSPFEDYTFDYGSTYYYRIKACNINDVCSDFSNKAQAVALIPPDDFSADYESLTRIKLSWNDNSNEDFFRLKRNGNIIADNISADTTEYTDLDPDNINENTTYDYEILACQDTVDGVVCSSDTTTADIGEFDDNTVLNFDINYDLGEDEIEINWDKGNWEDVIQRGYEFQGNEHYAEGFKDDLAPPTYFRHFTEPIPGTIYTMKIRAGTTEDTSPPLSVNYGDWYEVDIGYGPPPTGLSISSCTPDQVTVIWDDTTYEDHFNVARAYDEDGCYYAWHGGSTVAWGVCFVQFGETVNDNVYTYNVSDPTEEHFFRVEACKDIDGTECCAMTSNSVSVTPANCGGGGVPDIPSNLNGSAISTSEIELNWDDNSSGETYFALKRNGEIIDDNINPNTTDYSDSGLEPDTSYTYQIKACNGAGCSAPSNETSITTYICNPGTTKTQSCYIENGTGQQTATCNASGVWGNWGQCEVTECDNGYHESGNECVPDVSIPTPPSNLNGSAISTSEIELNWVDNSSGETHFALKRNGDIIDDSIDPNTTDYSDSGLEPDTSYTYQIKACNNEGCSAWSNEEVVTTMEETGPTFDPPSNLEIINIEDDQIKLSWQDNSDNEDGFIMERKCGTLDFSVIVDNISANTTNYIDYPIAPGIEFSYRMKAFNQDGETDYSNIITGTTVMTYCCEIFPSWMCTNGCSCQASY